MNIRALAFVVLLAGSNLVYAQDASDGAAADSGSKFAFGGNVFIALQNWANVNTTSDSKTGAGFTLNLGIGAKLDKDFTLLIGPQLGVNRWDAYYKSTTSSTTADTYFETYDAGIQLTADFGDMMMTIGAGQASYSYGVVIGGTDTRINGTKDYPYKSFSIGFKSDIWYLGVGATNYDDYLKTANRAEIQLGLAF